MNKVVHYSIIGIFISLYILVATISMINSVEFFDLAHNNTLSWCLAIGFELGAASSLAGIIILDKTNKNLVWGLFILLTLFQMMANSYHSYVNLENYQGWIELFGLDSYDKISQKRILSVISGAILPLVALGFIKSLVDYVKPRTEEVLEKTNDTQIKQITVQPDIIRKEDGDLMEREDTDHKEGIDSPSPNSPLAIPEYKP